MRAIQLKPEYPEAHANLGRAMDRLGRSEDALVAWTRAVELRPSLAKVRQSVAGSPRRSEAIQDSLPHARRTTPAIDQDLFFAIFNGPRSVKRKWRGMVTRVELAALVALVRSFRCRRLAEFGVGNGANAAAILAACHDPESYVGVDVPPGSMPSLAYQSREVPAQAGQFALHEPRFKLLIREGGTLQLNNRAQSRASFSCFYYLHLC
jgi:hypothetical protein